MLILDSNPPCPIGTESSNPLISSLVSRIYEGCIFRYESVLGSRLTQKLTWLFKIHLSKERPKVSEKYSILVIKKENGRFFYVRLKDSSTGKYQSMKSVDVLAKKLGNVQHITSRPMAIAVVEEALKTGLLGDGVAEIPTVRDFLLGFWNFDTSPYVLMRNKGAKERIHRDYVDKSRRYCETLIIPRLPKGLLVTQIKPKHLEKIQIDLLKKYSPKYWLNVINAVRVPFNELERKGIIGKNPVNALDRIAPDSREREILTHAEATALCEQIKKDMAEGNIEEKYGLAILLALSTGMRMGEIRALHRDAIELFDVSDRAVIHVDRAYAQIAGFKNTKSGKKRNVTVAKGFAEQLLKVAEQNPWGNGLVFWATYRDTPLHENTINEYWNRELEAIGIGEEERKRRFLSFHSTRHYCNTEMVSRVGVEMTREVIGHDSLSMSEHYDHAGVERALKIGEKVGDIIDWQIAE